MQNSYWRNNIERHSLLKNIPLTLFERVWKGYSRFYYERELETKHNCNILTLTLMAISVVSFSLSSAAQPEVQGPTTQAAGFLYHILSPTGLVSKLTDFPSSASYIIVQLPPQYLWIDMFDCHQAGITVMQFTSHSLPVHQSMTVAWDFTLSHIVSQACLRDFYP